VTKSSNAQNWHGAEESPKLKQATHVLILLNCSKSPCCVPLSQHPIHPSPNSRSNPERYDHPWWCLPAPLLLLPPLVLLSERRLPRPSCLPRCPQASKALCSPLPRHAVVLCCHHAAYQWCQRPQHNLPQQVQQLARHQPCSDGLQEPYQQRAVGQDEVTMSKTLQQVRRNLHTQAGGQDEPAHWVKTLVLSRAWLGPLQPARMPCRATLQASKQPTVTATVTVTVRVMAKSPTPCCLPAR